MSTAQQQLLVAQQKLKTAEANAVRERKEQAAKDLETVRAEGRQVKAELEKLVQELSQFDALQNAFAREMAGWDAAIRRHYDLKPTDEDFPSQQDLDEAWVTVPVTAPTVPEAAWVTVPTVPEAA